MKYLLLAGKQNDHNISLSGGNETGGNFADKYSCRVSPSARKAAVAGAPVSQPVV